MYINYKLLTELDITTDDFHTLVLLNQKEPELIDLRSYHKLTEMSLTATLKNGEKRLSVEGKSLLSAVTTPEYTVEINNTLEDVLDIYKQYSKPVGNSLEVRKRLIWFVTTTGFSQATIVSSIEDYISESGEFTMKLDNLLWKPASLAFSIHMNLNGSKLYEYIMTKFNIPHTFFLKEKVDKTDSWLFEVSRLKISKGLSSDLYFTGSYEGDKSHQDYIKKHFKTVLFKR